MQNGQVFVMDEVTAARPGMGSLMFARAELVRAIVAIDRATGLTRRATPNAEEVAAAIELVRSAEVALICARATVCVSRASDRH